MLGFFGRLFNRPKGPEAERFVFPFWDGTRKRSADPLDIETSFVNSLGEGWRKKVATLTTPAVPYGAIGQEAAKLRQQRRELQAQILLAVDTAFGVQPFKDGVGLTQEKRLALLEAFNWFCVDLIERARPFVLQQSRASPSTASPPVSNGPVSSSVAG